MPTYLEALKGAIGSAYRGIVAGNRAAAKGIVSAISGSPTAQTSASSSVLRNTSELAKFLGNWAGNQPLQPPPPPPYSGGQCATTYQVNFIGNRNGTPTSSGFQFATGPLGGLVSSTSGGAATVSIQSASGNVALFTSDAADNPTVTITSVVRLDGSPDSCGNPPSSDPTDTSQGSRDIVGVPITWTDAGGNPGSGVADIGFGLAYFDVNFDIKVPVTVKIGSVSIPFTFNLTTGDINVNFGGGRSSRTIDPSDCCCDDYGLPDDPNDALPPSVDPAPGVEKDDDGFKVLVGVITTLVDRADVFTPTVVGDENNPLLYVPRLATVRFLCAVNGAGDAAWSEAIDVKSGVQYTQVPSGLRAVDFKVLPAAGAVLESIPVYRERQSYAPPDPG